MKKTLLIVPVLAFTASVVGQESKPVGLSVRVGMFYPSVDVAKKEGKSWFLAGLDWKIKDMKAEQARSKSTSISLSVDAYQKGDMGAIPVLVNWVSRSNEWYWSAGAGVAFNKDFRISGLDTETIHDTRFAYQATFGYDFVKRKSPLFAEVKYFGNARDRLNGFAFAVGIRL